MSKKGPSSLEEAKKSTSKKYCSVWLHGGKFFCSRDCAGHRCIPFIYAPEDAVCASCGTPIKGKLTYG